MSSGSSGQGSTRTYKTTAAKLRAEERQLAKALGGSSTRGQAKGNTPKSLRTRRARLEDAPF